jgi:hypothetical protein
VSKDIEYTVGYKKPPMETRFKKGQSGNPKGRPKASDSTDWDKIVEKELNRIVTVPSTGKRIKMSELIVSRQVHKAATGDHRATSFLCKRTERRELAGAEGLSPILDAMRALNAKHEAGDASRPLVERPSQQELSLNETDEDDGA